MAKLSHQLIAKHIHTYVCIFSWGRQTGREFIHTRTEQADAKGKNGLLLSARPSTYMYIYDHDGID